MSSPTEGFNEEDINRCIKLHGQVDNIISLIQAGELDTPSRSPPLYEEEFWEFSSNDRQNQDSPSVLNPPRLSSLSTVYSLAGKDQRVDPDSFLLPGIDRLHSSSVLNSVSSEDSLESGKSHSSRPKSAVSNTTVRMAQSTAAQKKVISLYHSLVSSYEDELADLTAQMVSPSRITHYLELSNDLMRSFKSVIETFTDNLREDFSEEMFSNAVQLKDACKGFYRALMAKDNESSLTPTPDVQTRNPSPSHSGQEMNVIICQQRVVDLIDSLENQVRGCVENFKGLLSKSTTTSFEVKSCELLLKQYSDHSQEIQRQVDNLVRSATTAGDNHSVRRLDGMTLLLNNNKSSSRLFVANAHSKLGILPGISDTGVNKVKFKSPFFDGTFDPKSLDYFTFESELLKYFSVVGLYSDFDRGLKLKTDCLGGQALACVGQSDLYSQCMILLKANFGKPNLLFLSRQNELRNCNKCPDGVIERREWLLTVRELLRSLSALSTRHKLEEMYDSSNIMQILQSLMRDKDHEEFRELIKRKRRDNPDLPISKKYLYSELTSFLDRLSTDAGTELDYALTSSYRSCMDVLKSAKGKSSAHQTFPADSSSVGGSSSGSGMNLSNLDLSKETPLLLTPDHYSALPDSVPHMGASQAHVVNKPDRDGPTEKTYPPPKPMNKSETPSFVSCRLCKKEHTHLFYCPEFRKTRVESRFKRCLYAQACYRCLRLDVGLDFSDRDEWFQTHKPYCSDKWVCKVGKCANKPEVRQNSFLLCSFHAGKNKSFENELQNMLKNLKPSSHDNKGFFASFPTGPSVSAPAPAEILNSGSDVVIVSDISDNPIYLLQYLEGQDKSKLLMFYDSGCWGSVINSKAMASLHTQTVRPGPTRLEVAGAHTIEVPYGDEQFYLELEGNSNQLRYAELTGLHMDEVSSTFPEWPLVEVWEELNQAYTSLHSDLCPLPEVTDTIGGSSVDVMLGIRYQTYFPTALYSLPSGLTIYRSKFKGFNGIQGILGGPHPCWEHILISSNLMGPCAFLTAEFRAFKMHCSTLWDTPSLTHEESVKCLPIPPSFKEVEEQVPVPILQSTQDSTSLLSAFHQPQVDSAVSSVECNCDCHLLSNPFIDEPYAYVQFLFSAGPSKQLKEFQLLEEIGSEISYRCIDCRNCNNCRKGEEIEMSSLQEDKEQYLIEKSIHLDVENKVCVASLPFIVPPESSLIDNQYVARKILQTQLKLIDKNPESRQDVLSSFQKLKDNNFVVRLDSLSPEQQETCMASDSYTIPWRTVSKVGSLSTPTRLVFDASSRTKSGLSLNDCLAKGRNRLASLFHLLVSFRVGASALTSDVSMAYNSIQLDPSHYKYQKFLWVDELTSFGIVAIWVVCTLIYGVRPSGQQTAVGFTLVADHAVECEPELSIGAELFKSKIYVDDIIASFLSNALRDLASDAIPRVLAYGHQTVKSVTRSGHKPDERVSHDGVHVGLVGYRWDVVDDKIKLDIKPLYLGKTKRGKLPPLIVGDIKVALSSLFTKRVITGKVACVFDPLGIALPVTIKFKIDLSEICQLKLGWDEMLPETLLDLWVSNLQKMQELAALATPRSLLSLPHDKEFGVELIVSTDSSQHIAAACVHARIKLLSGEYACLLIAAKSKLVTKATIPKGELKACQMGAVLGSIVSKNFGDLVTKTLYVTDSMISLWWLKCDTRPLQTGVRNLVIEIRRFTTPSLWHHTESCHNVCDIATRPVDISAILEGSDWQCGRDWMRGPSDQMPVKSIDQISLSVEEKKMAMREIRNNDIQGVVLSSKPFFKNSARSEFNDFLINPVDFMWPKFVTRIAMIFFVLDLHWKGYKKTAAHLPASEVSSIINIPDSCVDKAKKYIFSKTTLEVLKFNSSKKLKNIGKMQDGILMYQGRILAGMDALMADSMLDLDRLAFAKPIVDRHSPVAYSVMTYVHIQVCNHGGAISCLRASREICFILNGKSLANEVRDGCLFCIRYKQKMIQVEMGPVHENRLRVAPAFNVIQLDLFGPIDGKCGPNHRTNMKLWGVVIKCPTTLAVAAYCMPKYDTDSFLQSFSRHTNRYGLPVEVFIDAGPNLISAFADTDFEWTDITQELNAGQVEKIKFHICPVQSHNYNGVVERSIRSIRELLSSVFKGIKFDPLSFETALGYITNELNSLPLCLGSRYTNLETLDLITPSRLLLGRNNKRAPIGRVKRDNPGPILQQMAVLEEAWWESWKRLKINDYVPRANKWHKSVDVVVRGDIVVFPREPSNTITTSTWRIGRVKEVETSKDGIDRVVVIEYRNFKEKVLRTTRRAARQVAVIVREVDVDFVGDLSKECLRQASNFCH